MSPWEESRTLAVEYLKKGWSLFPCLPLEKKPALKWKEFQERVPTEEEIEEWFSSDKEDSKAPPNLAIVTGRISSLVVLDYDPRHGDDILCKTLANEGLSPHVRTGGGGLHYYFSWKEQGGKSCELPRNSAGRVAPGYDIRAEGGYVLAPPSRTTKRYSWLFGDYPDGECPSLHSYASSFLRLPGVEHKTLSVPAGESDRGSSATGGQRVYFSPVLVSPPRVIPGGRNNAAASYAGKLLKSGMRLDAIWKELEWWNSTLPEPLETGELTAVFNSITRYRKERKSD